MAEKFDRIADVSGETEIQSLELLEKLVDVAKPEAVFSKPIKVGDTQLITASEIQVGLGYGHGLGSGPQYISNMPEEGEESEEIGMGGGGGGGGGASGRPIAVIHIREDSVEVEPILDLTKITLAFFTMLGSIFFLGSRINKGKIS